LDMCQSCIVAAVAESCLRFGPEVSITKKYCFISYALDLSFVLSWAKQQFVALQIRKKLKTENFIKKIWNKLIRLDNLCK
jgi:hypothetical protein